MDDPRSPGTSPGTSPGIFPGTPPETPLGTPTERPPAVPPGTTRTRQSIDALAELYLTGVQAPAPTATSTPGTPGTPGPSHTDPLEGPAPIRLAPKLAPAGAATLDAYSALAADPLHTSQAPGADGHPILRLTEDEPGAISHGLPGGGDTANDRADRPTAHPVPAQAETRAVILGNLPGLSGPWLTQYAQRIAQEHGPVAVLHVDDQVIDFELVEPRKEAHPAPRVSDTPVRIPPTEPGGLVDLLDALVRAEQSPVRTVLVRLTADPDAVSAARLSAVDHWSVLSGADDVSVAAAYRMLKQVVEHDPRNADKRVGLMVMGSDEADSTHAANKIASTSASFLETPVQLIGHLRQMQPVTVRQLGSFPDPAALWPQLTAWMDTLEAPQTDAPQASEPPTPAPAPGIGIGAMKIAPNLRVPPRRPVQADPEHIAAPPPPPVPVQTSAPPVPPPAPSVSPALNAPRTATVVHEEPPPVAHAADGLDLVAILAQGPSAIAGGLAMEAKIPAAPTVQLAVDAMGAIHLLAHPGLAADARRIVPELMEAKRWAEENRSLLALTQRDRGFADAPPVCHLFTDRPEQATTLVARLGDTLRLHLLQKVTLGRETGWFCTPLN